MKSEAGRTIHRVRFFRYEIILEGLLVGVASGFFVSLLRLGISASEARRTLVLQQIRAGETPGWLVPSLLAAAFLIVCLTLRHAPAAAGGGIPVVMAELQGRKDVPWLRTIIGKLAGTTAAIGAGLAMGNEGPSVQIGAMCGKMISRLFGRLTTEEKILITAGSGAGLACAFSAPFAGVMFTLEVMTNNMSREVVISTISAAISADFVSAYIFGLHPVIRLGNMGALPLKSYWVLLLAGIVLGAFGVLFNRATDILQTLFGKIPSKYVRAAVPFLVMIPVGILMPDALGTGYFMIGRMAYKPQAWQLILIFIIVKFCFAMVSSTSGVPGGIFLPILVVGSSTGALLFALLSDPLGIPEIYLANFVIYGMVGYFAAVIRAPLSGVILVTELTGDFNNFLSVGVVALVSVIAADLLKGRPIYSQLLERMLAAEEKAEEEAAEKAAPEDEAAEEYARHTAHVAHAVSPKVLTNAVVIEGSRMSDAPISEIHLPEGALVVSVARNGREFVPNGDSILRRGDHLTVLCSQNILLDVNRSLRKSCGRIG